MSRLNPPLSSRDHLRGSLEAPIQLLEFGDYECPFCGRAFPIVNALEEALGDRLCFAFRHFPLSQVHPHAALAAEAAEAAASQGMFWPMHNVLFAHQDALELPDLQEYVAALGLDVRAFVEDLQTHRHARKIRESLRSGALSGVNGTPCFFVNGRRHEGAYDFESLLGALTGEAETGLFI